MTEIQQNSRLLNLPGELRTQIYHAVLNPDNGAEEYNSYRIDKRGKRRTEDRWPKHWLALIYTCRQIYTEAIGIVYGHLVFDFSDYTSENQLAKLHWFLDTIGLANVRSIRRIAMHAPDLWAIDPRNNGPGHATERETDGNIEGNNNVQGNGYDEVDSDTESLFNFIFPEDHDDEVAVEISQAGLECLETLRQRCPALDYLQLCFFPARRPPTKLPNRAVHPSNVAESQDQAIVRMSEDLPGWPGLSRIECALLDKTDGHVAFRTLIFVRSGDDWYEELD
ncbi:hypothetical protein VTJ04DRAFT_5250 [Mycothermus thermophilus]|uniref:uncharacterized protein n=1 Tax=Humicola insolens TaxID=85995 RepID=UPI0037438F9D